MSGRPSISLLSFLLPALTAAICLSARPAHAQLKQAQEKGWSGLKDGYSLVAGMRDNKSNRTRANFETALSKILSSMADMSPSIDKMGERVAEEDKSYATGLRDNIRSAWRGVSDAHQRLRTAYDSAKESTDKLAEISDEIDKLKSALEQYDTAFRTGYNNYKARWDELKREMDKVDGEFSSARSRADALEKQHDDLFKEEQALAAEMDKAREEYRKLDKVSDEIAAIRVAARRNQVQAHRDHKAAEVKRYADELNRAHDLSGKLVEARVATMRKLAQLDSDSERKGNERARVWRDLRPFLEQAGVLEVRSVNQFLRFTLWDAEFPAGSYSLQSLR